MSRMSALNTPEPLSDQTVRKVARLSRLELRPEQVHSFSTRLSAVLGYIDRLGELDLQDVAPLSNPLDATNRVDADEPRPGLPTQTLMNLAPDAHPPFVKVPRVLGDGGA